MEYTLNGQDIVNIHDCLSQINDNSLLVENQRGTLQQLRQYVHFCCTSLVKKVKDGDSPFQVQFTERQVQLLDGLMNLHIRDLQYEFDNYEGNRESKNELADDIIAYNLTLKKIGHLVQTA